MKILGILKEIRSQLGKAAGDRVSVTVEADLAERSATLRDDLRLALSDADLLERFLALSFTHQREYVTWIEDAKQPSTRARRVAQTIERVRH
ncbi:MAG: YdeI/OmpD-associated family protein [Acidimicrobiales bacterium]